MAKVFIEESTLTAIGDAIRCKTGDTELINTTDMATVINDISGDGAISHIPEEAFHFDGNCNAAFANEKWIWFLDKYRDRITINATSITETFANSNMEYIPNMTYTGSPNNGSSVLMNESLRTFNNCKKVKDLSNLKIKPSLPLYEAQFQDTFKNCSSLRKMPDFTEMDGVFTGNSIYGWTGTFNTCSVLDEILSLPIAQRKSYGQYLYQNIVNNCNRLKNFTFRTDNGSPLVAGFNSAVLDFSTYTGWAKQDLDITNVLYSHGIGLDKKVTDDASYQALKNDPDWWTTDVAYSRYNHDSAVNTINSLPDTSAFITENGGTNTIKFKGTAGSATDGGAINTLTEEEIAIATAKGWTVQFV